MMDPWIDDVVFECGCCGMYVILGTELVEAPTFPYTYENATAMLAQAQEALEEVKQDAITAPAEKELETSE